MKNYKTFYSVTYRQCGADYPSIAWFDDKEKATEFGRQDYHDGYVAHRVSNPKTIDDMLRRVAETELENEN